MTPEPGNLWGETAEKLNAVKTLADGRQYRIRFVLAVGASYLLDALLLYLFGLAGTIELFVSLTYALLGLGHVALFSLLHSSGFSDRFKNPHLTSWQMSYAILVQLTGIILATHLAPFFMGVLFVVIAFSMLRVSIKKALLAWLICCISIAVLMSFLPSSDFGVISPNRWEAILIWLTFSTLLLRTISIGYYGTILRRRIHQIGEVIEQASHHDHLTGALNRETILANIEEHISLSKHQSIPGCLAAIDIDDLKLINTSVGHSTGDTVLEQTAASIKQHLRKRDRLGRYGSTDFLLLLPATEMPEGLELVKRIVDEVGAATWYLISAQVQITISCGITEIRASDSPRNLIERAETALAEAKAKGKNQVVEKVLSKSDQEI